MSQHAETLGLLHGIVRNEAGQANADATVIGGNVRSRTDENGNYALRVTIGRDLVARHYNFDR